MEVSVPEPPAPRKQLSRKQVLRILWTVLPFPAVPGTILLDRYTRQAHGYLTSDDPLDARTILEDVYYEVFILVMLVLWVVKLINDDHSKLPGQLLIKDYICARMIEENIEAIGAQNEELIRRYRELREAVDNL